MPTLKHTHTFARVKIRRGWYRCTHPKCTYTCQAEFVKGKACICPGCGGEFIMDYEAMRRANPKCLNCSDTRKGKEYRAAKALVGDIFNMDIAAAGAVEDTQDEIGGDNS